MILLLFKIMATSFVLVIVIGLACASVLLDIPDKVEDILEYVVEALAIVGSLCAVAIILTFIWIL